MQVKFVQKVGYGSTPAACFLGLLQALTQTNPPQSSLGLAVYCDCGDSLNDFALSSFVWAIGYIFYCLISSFAIDIIQGR